MLDWDALIPAETSNSAKCPTFEAGREKTDDKPREWDEVSHSVPLEKASVPHVVGQVKASNGKACSHFFASVPLVPLKNQGRDKEPAEATGGPCPFCAVVDEKGNLIYRANPAAILLLLAWSQAKQIPSEDRAGLLLDLETMPPADQVRHWHGACLADGLNPWHILCLPAPLSGDDCTRCKNLTTRYEAIGEDRRRFHWACALGYLILEHGRGTERIYVAPPECQRWERWYPSERK